ncbi:hypothetical protein Patl1_36816 [Pistacia atlantica]|nr:hypothetical protein Patl1_36816 [Pistacia atlantica]
MAHYALRLRRSLPVPAALRRSLSSLVPALSSPPLLKPSISSYPPSSQQQSSSFLTSIVQSRPFRSYPTVSLSSNKTYHLYKEGDDITADTILFEGCDYNHWVILMDFPKDTKLTPEEMVKTYEETCAKGLNISSIPNNFSESSSPNKGCSSAEAAASALQTCKGLSFETNKLVVRARTQNFRLDQAQARAQVARFSA